jgi:hypothetical protein
VTTPSPTLTCASDGEFVRVMLCCALWSSFFVLRCVLHGSFCE